VVAPTEGNHITLSADAAGWGWFVDPTPALNEEFSQQGETQDFVATDGSAAAGKVDLLGVLIHELGHVLGLEHSDNGLDSMATTVTPGLRRMLGADELALMANLQQAVTAKPTASTTAQAEQYQVVINPLFINGNFSADTSGWSSAGQVAVANNAAVLTETTTSQTRLNQAFIVGANDRYLSFTLSDIALADANQKGFYGDAAYREVMDAATREMTTYRKVGDSGGCFAAGTMIHTRDGLKPIEDIHIGDWVLSKPESGEGDSAYKQVLRTTCFENKPVFRVDYSASHGGDSFIVTGNHPFWVVGYEPNYFPPDWDEPIEIGWTRADRLDRGMLLLLADGQIGQVSMIDPIWRTKTEGVGWIDRGRDSYQPREDGHLIDLRNGKIEEYFNKYGLSEFLDEYSFLDRDCDSEFAEEWGYKCTVYNFEVEDFHTYYVGTLEVWVHNTNCFENSLKTTINNVQRSPNLDVYYSRADVGDFVATMQKPKGQILLYEAISDPTRPWVKFQDGVEGGLRSKYGSYFLARTLLYKNPIATGRNFIALGDGAAYIRNNENLFCLKP
jgi:hypothetical protein